MQGYLNFENQFGVFHDLMKFRVREILLVSSHYDAFVLEEDGRLSERIFSEYVDLNLRFIPRIYRVSNAAEALAALANSTFDLVITMTRISSMDLQEFGKAVKIIKPDLPVVLLTYEWLDEETRRRLQKSKSIDKVFYWSGDTRILVSIIKYAEDLLNVETDMKLGVQVTLIIEDSPKFYSQFLPIIYTEIMTQTRLLISDGVNDLHRLMRMRARPKILLAENYEQAMGWYKKCRKNLLGIISDVSYPRNERMDENAGFRLAEVIKGDFPDLPFLLLSTNPECMSLAYEKSLAFINKNSENLFQDLQSFILSNFGFGDFVFKDDSGHVYGTAQSLHDFERMLHIIPDESILYHASRNHISIWLRARTEFAAAEKLRPRKVGDFPNVEALRQDLIQEIQRTIQKNQLGVITDFSQVQIETASSFVRLGNGSLGGKARGIAFINSFLNPSRLLDQFRDKMEIKIPQSFVICSEVFEEFISANRLQEFAVQERENEEIAEHFLRKTLPEKIAQDLKTLLAKIRYPLAVRSSSILEDSQSLPFAGLYSTFMLPNGNPDLSIRLAQLANAIKLIFASVFYKSPKEYVRNTNFRIEEEKMAVIVQEMIGRSYKNGFYPLISGVAQSYNYYPFSHMEPEDGIVQLALGLGAIIAEGAQIFRFSPKYPEMNPPYSSVSEFKKKSQSYFFALDMSTKNQLSFFLDEKFSLKKLDLSAAEEDGNIQYVASTFSSEDNVIRDTVSIPGARVLTFARILKYQLFPLAEVLAEILATGRNLFGSHIEIEFAISLGRGKEKKFEFNLLQVRPMVAGKETYEVALDRIDSKRIILASNHALGNEINRDIQDVIFVDPDTFSFDKSRIVAQEVGQLNQRLIDENRVYALIGFGRWGTLDPWLGIPVEWFQMSRAKVIIETNFRDSRIEPSQGSHFFHNMISLKMGYLHIREQNAEEFINWNWLREQKMQNRTPHVCHVRLNKPLEIRINARLSRGVILKP